MANHDSFNPNNAAECALFDYLDNLLHDPQVCTDVTLDLFAADDIPESIASTKVMPLAAVARARRPANVVDAMKTFAYPRFLEEARPYAEPVRSLPVRIPTLAAPIEVKPASMTAQPAVAASVETPVVELPLVATPVVDSEIPAPTAIVAVPEIATEELGAPSVESFEDIAQLAWTASGRPQWAQQPFECLLFLSGGLTLAVPLVELGTIYPLEKDDVTEIFGQIDWFLGLIRTSYGNVRAIDTARVVMPERYQATMAEGYRYVVTLHNSDWGLCVDAVAGTVVLDPDAVRWRSERSKRPWLAGTVIEKMCALLDPAQLCVMFDQFDHNRNRLVR